MYILTLPVLVTTIGWYTFMPYITTPTLIQLQPDLFRYLFPITWLWYCWLGILLHYDSVQRVLQFKSIQKTFGGLTLIAAILMIFDSWLYGVSIIIILAFLTALIQKHPAVRGVFGLNKNFSQ